MIGGPISGVEPQIVSPRPRLCSIAIASRQRGVQGASLHQSDPGVGVGVPPASRTVARRCVACMLYECCNERGKRR